MRPTRHPRGFTLIELLLVIAVIGMLSSVFLLGQRDTSAKRRDVQRYAHMKELQQALGLYMAKAQSYPVFDGCMDGSDPVNVGLRAQAVVTPDANFADPAKDPATCYYYSGTATDYTIRYTIEKDSPAGKAGTFTVVP